MRGQDQAFPPSLGPCPTCRPACLSCLALLLVSMTLASLFPLASQTVPAILGAAHTARWERPFIFLTPIVPRGLPVVKRTRSIASDRIAWHYPHRMLGGTAGALLVRSSSAHRPPRLRRGSPRHQGGDMVPNDRRECAPGPQQARTHSCAGLADRPMG